MRESFKPEPVRRLEPMRSTSSKDCPRRSPARRGKRPVLICLVLAAGLLTLSGSLVASAWLTERSLERVRRLMDEDKFAEARRWLVAFPVRWSNSPEAAYRLGVCEHARGDVKAALAAWERVAPEPIWTVRAGLARARTLVGDLGRFHDGEVILADLLSRGGQGRHEVRHTLAELYFWQGRRHRVRALIEANWSTAPDPIREVGDHWRVDNSPLLLENIREEVERASQLAPDDDRVWLARASLNIQSGRFDDAGKLLERCLERRPDDPDVWRASLDLARAMSDLSGIQRCLVHVPADLLTDAERLELRALLASLLRNPEAERAALLELSDQVAEPWVLERLAVLARQAGQDDQAAEYRLRKARADAAKDRYRLLMDEPMTPALLVELGALAESLGRRFEAVGWWTLRARGAPGDILAAEALARLARVAPSVRLGSNATLAEVMADLLPARADGARLASSSGDHSPGRLPRFTEDAVKSGLNFTYDNGRSPRRQIPETTAGGVALLDYDGDGLLDVYAVQGGAFPPDPARPNSGDRLFRNTGRGSFVDVTEASGIAAMKRGYGNGVAVGDYDNDGRPDLFITRWRSYALYHNKGDGTFEDVTERAGLGGDRDWPTSAAWADLDNDGDLDLYVCHYLQWDAEHPTLCDRKTVAARSERVEPDQVYNYCSPRLFPSLPDHLFRNDGGRFVDVTAEAGIVDTHGRGLGVVAADLDADGLVDLFVANDTSANFLWHNLGGWKFEDAAILSGVACNASGAFQAGMGTACGDLDGDLLPDLFVNNFYGESTTFFRNHGGLSFSDETAAVGLAAPSRYLLGFGVCLLDADNDGRLDLATANGHVNDDRPDYPYDMPALLLMGGADARLTDVTHLVGAPWTTPRVARGLAAGDIDNDGLVDLLSVAQNSPLFYFHNQTEAGHALSFLLEGTRSNRDGVGAVVTVRAGGRNRRAWKCGGGSFVSASDPRVHFGLGDDPIEQVEVRWPSGRTDRFSTIEPDRVYLLREGDAQPKFLHNLSRP